MDIRHPFPSATRRRRPGRRPPRPVTSRAEALAVGLGCQVAPPRRPPSSRRA